MKPVLVLQHLGTDGPAYLAQWPAARGMLVDIVDSQAGQRAPAHLRSRHAALAILGGEMSADDPLPCLRDAEALFREAVVSGVPTLGHCLGGQLMARALGARVVDSPAPEVGWQPLQVLDKRLRLPKFSHVANIIPHRGNWQRCNAAKLRHTEKLHSIVRNTTLSD